MLSEDCEMVGSNSTNNTMTYSTNRQETVFPPAKQDEQSPDDTKFCSPKFGVINLEDDIEKVEVASSVDELPETPTVEDKPSSSPLPPNQTDYIASWLEHFNETENKTAPTTTNRVVKFQDLPYMGEMTLDNSKPRRGRKPKKADICHLIYKNYGTIFPGTPNPNTYLEREVTAAPRKPPLVLMEPPKDRSNVQNRIISSLLERRLTQEHKRTKTTDKTATKDKKNQNEPLNLCIRDLNNLKIRLLKKNDNTYTTSEIKIEPPSGDEGDAISISPIETSHSTTESDSPDYVYWPNSGVFIHPMTLQDHLLMYDRLEPTKEFPGSPKQESQTNKNFPAVELRKVLPKIKPSCSSDNFQSGPITFKTKRNSSSSVDKTPTKRKRSAIFIPPIPTENQTNPATEVSICKFKFTGGAKPSLQEKKMLSVDSGGNFRYYSGTGDKNMRGYEFFPRETLQQQVNNTQGSSTGAFLQASGEKIYPLSPVSESSSKKSSPDFLLSPELPSSSLPSVVSVSDLSAHQNKKRKSRKSLQREKLEQTFKEKGFLIQTQQLESAEGATYCKFRQLRKFTRYLFRSWKDYLPGNVRELQEEERLAASQELFDPDSLTVSSSELT